jgi:DNA-directed RNA polymerase specialized sigma24 family protein
MAEVATLLGLKEGAVRVRAHRGYKLLAEKLALLWAKRT